MRTTLAASLLTVVLIGGCGERTGSPEPQGESTEIPYECAGAHFDLANFQPGEAEQGSDPKAAALRRLLDFYEAEDMPQQGWVEVAADNKIATFIAKDAARFYYVTVERAGGRWTDEGWGGCDPRASIDDGSILEWSLDPDAPPPSDDDTVIKALVVETDCHGFDDPTDRIREPTVIYDDERVLVVLTADPLKGLHSCPGTPPVPYEFTLPEPVGDRTLFDAGTYPPRRADKPPRIL